MKKQITIDQLRPGMYVVSTDRGWIYLPFFKRKIKNLAVVEKLKASKVRNLVIDISKGSDVDGDLSDFGRLEEVPEVLTGDSLRDEPEHEMIEDSDEAAHENTGPAMITRSAREPEQFDRDHPLAIRERAAKSRRVHEDVLEQTNHLMGKIEKGVLITAEETDRQVNQLIDQIFEDPQSLLCLSVLKNAGEYTYNHALHMSILSLFVGRSMGLTRDKLLVLGKGALLHDIGKCMVPKEILNKPGKLTSSEYKIMRTHVEKGVKYLTKVNSFSSEVLCFVAEHHERIDGSGYPRGLKGNAISWYGKIGAVLDIYDILIHKNYYKDPEDPKSVLKVMSRMTRSLLDVKAFNILEKCLGSYPPGTLLMLDNGEMAVSFQPNPDLPERPKVLLITKPDGTFRDLPQPSYLMETDENKEGYLRSVVTALSPEEANFNPLEILFSYNTQEQTLPIGL